MKIVMKENKQVFSPRTYQLGYSDETVFEFDKIFSYVVYGICIWKEVIHYLLIEKEGYLPSWYPAELFSITDNSVPFEWYFNFYGDENEPMLSAIWGYKELAMDKNHYYDLIERESKDISIFLHRKKEIDEYSN